MIFEYYIKGIFEILNLYSKFFINIYLKDQSDAVTRIHGHWHTRTEVTAIDDSMDVLLDLTNR